ncbi:Eco47II family restriction endonuclease [Pseudoalteromonas distincta]|uniref:Eco47II family restriction endonuclease n=1 Tax=Pseudoalteromonas distincta TaxID=77608 RepID=UPI00241EED76|nr:Eco47II family restriction endonuclease [Pseudoalteromonas distincta]|tara:strand:+ start:93628 stop:94380 length:753 start_codon:yes stop_codon:yes gene_type:complete
MINNNFFYSHGVKVDFFNRENLKKAIENSVIKMYEAQVVGFDLYRNTLDCFSASIDALLQGISMDDWLKQEKERQIQKTKQNAIGSLHENIMGSIDGVTSLPVGNLVDIVCEDKKIIAEVKNKHNTTKGNHKVQIYRDLAQKLAEINDDFTGYYVEVLPKGAKSYDNAFTPSDNQTNKKLPKREDIRVIDGKSFYAKLTGNDGALNELYESLPSIVAEIIKEQYNVNLDADSIVRENMFSENFVKAYGEK